MNQIRKNLKVMMVFLAVMVFAVFHALLSLFLFTDTLDYSNDWTPTQEVLQFSEAIVRLSSENFEYYGGELYSPEDFKAGVTKTPATDSGAYEHKQNAYGTYRIVLHLTPGERYSIAGNSVTFAEKMYVNGELLLEVGTVADNEKDFVPRTKYVSVCFTPLTEETEIIIQRANFNHYNSAGVQLDIGVEDKVSLMTNRYFMGAIFQLGLLISGVLLNLGLFAVQSHRASLYLSLSCMFFAIRASLTNPKPIMIVFPELNWYLGHRLECCSMGLAITFMALYLMKVFPNLVPKRFQVLFIGGCGLTVGVYALSPSMFYTRYHISILGILFLLLALFFFFVIKNVIGRLRDYRLSQRLIMDGGIVFLLGLLIDTLRYTQRDLQMTKFGIIIFVYLNVLAIAIDLNATRQDLEEVKEKEAQLNAMNLSLTKLYGVRENVIAGITHELNTPLTVISGYAHLSANAVRDGRVDDKLLNRLQLIEKEALRLGRLTEHMKMQSYTDERVNLSERVSVEEILKNTKDFCAILCERYNNHIAIQCRSEMFISCIPDEVYQILYNLVANANRQMVNGTITLKAESETDRVRFACIDNGKGMTEETKWRVFEVGYSPDGSSGLGLPLVKEIVESYGGTIHVTDGAKGGTIVSFTLPKAE